MKNEKFENIYLKNCYLDAVPVPSAPNLFVLLFLSTQGAFR